MNLGDEGAHPMPVRFPRACGDEPQLRTLSGLGERFPRACGDEPGTLQSYNTTEEFSPRLRG